MEQFEQSMDMMRNGCAPKFKVKVEQLDALRNGYFDESNAELKVQNIYFIHKYSLTL